MNSPTNGRPWLARVLNEAVRLALVAMIALAASYFAFSQTLATQQRIVDRECHQLSLIRNNQSTVLTTLLDMFDTLNDRGNIGLTPLNPADRTLLLNALGNLPESVSC